ncbi:MAG: lysophospholipid acyltransferase family protein [Campylobacterales bacterium]|nr:lysophospholipid acyltransferase family protein [Campylobacterales bacterium]NQY53887.1 lysophospholipid acyltransferase family protein [Campylobacteraceae bacterium]
MKRLLRYLQITVLPFILQLFIRFIYLSSKKTFHLPKKELKDKSYLIAFWHGELIMQPFNFKKLRKKQKISAMISEHRDGEAITRTVQYLGINSLRGSSTRGGVKALIGAIKELKAGNDIAITPDGPKGPRHSVADGIVLIAQKTNTKILFLNVKVDNYWQFKSWDKFVIPKPFSKIDFYISEAYSLDSMENEDAKSFVQEKLLINAMK